MTTRKRYDVFNQTTGETILRTWGWWARMLCKADRQLDWIEAGEGWI